MRLVPRSSHSHKSCYSRETDLFLGLGQYSVRYQHDNEVPTPLLGDYGVRFDKESPLHFSVENQRLTFISRRVVAVTPSLNPRE